MNEYRQRTPEQWPGLFRFAVNDPPRATPRQATRWATQDAAYATRPDGVAGRILESLRDSPATCDEIEQRLEMTHQTASATINALMRGGKIRANGSRPTRSGRSARVWEVVP